MKKNVSLLILFLFSVAVFCQDVQILSSRDINGTARYVSLCGAMSAVGGDPTAALDNPAGLGIYRRSEALISFGGVTNLSHQNGYGKKYADDAELQQVSMVFSFGDDARHSGFIHNNILLSANCLKSFCQEYAGRGTMRSSLPATIALKTNDLSASALEPAGRWDDPNVGWLSILGYDTYLIDIAENNQWISSFANGQNVNSKIDISESGGIYDYSLAWGANINNRWFVGLGANMRTIIYNKALTYQEVYNSTYFTLNTALEQKGVGINGTFGLIYQPLHFLRVGASIQSPSSILLQMASHSKLVSVITDTYECISPEWENTYGNYNLPFRTTLGAACLFNKRGFLSVEYDFEHWKNMSDLHTLKAGAEFVINDNLFFNVGYAYESNFLTYEPTYIYSELAVRTDTDFRNLKNSQYFSGGFGYRGRAFIAQLAYQYKQQKYNLYANELADAFDMHVQTHRIVFSLGWHSARN